jgi:hypothetical protein
MDAMGESPKSFGVLRALLNSRRRHSVPSGWESVSIVSFDFVAGANERLPLTTEGQASARDLMFDLMSQALTIFRNCIKSGAHDRFGPDRGAGMTFLAQGVHRLPGLMKVASMSGGSYQTIAVDMFGNAPAGLSLAAREEAARDYLFDNLEAWFLDFRTGETNRALRGLANAMHNQPDLMKRAATSDGDYGSIIIEFFRWVPVNYRVWAIQTLMRQPRPDQVLVESLTTFDGGEDRWRELTVTIDHPDGRRERRPWVSDSTIDWLCHHYEADRTA